MKYLAVLYLLFLSLLVRTCVPMYSVVEFEVLEPATLSFPDEVQQLIFLNRAPLTPQVWSEMNQRGLEARQLVLLDTLICNNLNRGIFEVLKGSPIQRFQQPVWLSERRSDTTYMDAEILTKREVRDFCVKYGADALISLEYYKVSLDQQYDYYSDAPDQVMNQFYILASEIQWIVHLLDRPSPLDRYTMRDTVYYPTILNGEFQQSFSGVAMIGDAFYDSGMKYGNYLVPMWTFASRRLFNWGAPSLREAARYTAEADWESAFRIWKQLSFSADSTIAAKACTNLAVYYELEDRLDSAKFWLNRGLALDSIPWIVEYREELFVRLENQSEIQNQVN